MLSALAVFTVPMTSHAAEVKLWKSGDGYAVFVGQGTENPGQIIDDIFNGFSSGNFFCPETPAAPPQTDAPAQPDDQLPETPVLPDDQKPEAPVLPDDQKPEAPALPDNQEPGTEAAPEDVHPYVLQILNLVNAERSKAGLSELKLDADVTAAANVRAKEIRQSFSHTRPNGTSFSSALTEQGISYRRSGENIAWGQKTPEQVMNGWMNSNGHRANILNANFENIGIGYYQDANGTNYWVQLFTA